MEVIERELSSVLDQVRGEFEPGMKVGGGHGVKEFKEYEEYEEEEPGARIQEPGGTGSYSCLVLTLIQGVIHVCCGLTNFRLMVLA
jgi:hypothetical protein